MQSKKEAVICSAKSYQSRSVTHGRRIANGALPYYNDIMNELTSL